VLVGGSVSASATCSDADPLKKATTGTNVEIEWRESTSPRVTGHRVAALTGTSWTAHSARTGTTPC
jgi:hypothetical protein